MRLMTASGICTPATFERIQRENSSYYLLAYYPPSTKRDGKYLENLGTYNPMTNPAEVKLNLERIQYWISVGAQPTETVASLIKHSSAVAA